MGLLAVAAAPAARPSTSPTTPRSIRRFDVLSYYPATSYYAPAVHVEPIPSTPRRRSAPVYYAPAGQLLPAGGELLLPAVGELLSLPLRPSATTTGRELLPAEVSYYQPAMSYYAPAAVTTRSY